MSTNNNDRTPFSSFLYSHHHSDGDSDVDGVGVDDAHEDETTTAIIRAIDVNRSAAKVIAAARVEVLETPCELQLCKRAFDFDTNDFSQATAEAALQLLFDMMHNVEAAIAEAVDASTNWGKEATTEDDDKANDDRNDSETNESEEIEEAEATLCPFSLEESMILASIEAMQLAETLDFEQYFVPWCVSHIERHKVVNKERRIRGHARHLWWKSKIAAWEEMAKDLEHQCHVVRWQCLLLSLQRNHPETTRTISCTKYEFCGYIKIHLPDFDLNEFKVPNGSGIAKNLGKALLHNTMVSTLSLQLGTLLSPERRSALLSSIQNGAGESITTAPVELDDLLRFLQTSTSLRRVVLDKHRHADGPRGDDVLPEPVERAMVDWFLKAISNSSHIDEVLLKIGRFSSAAFHNLMKTGPIRELEVSFSNIVLAAAIDQQHNDDSTEGIMGNQTLTSLTITSWPVDRALAEDILSSVPCLGRTLVELRVVARYRGFLKEMQRSVSVLSQYLAMTVGTLRSLTLEYFDFRKADIITLLSSLVHIPATTSNGMQSVSLVELTLKACRLDSGAERQLAMFLQNRATSGIDGRNEAMVYNSALRTLRIGDFSQGDEWSLPCRVTKSLLMATTDTSGIKTDHAAVEPASMNSTIGSQIHCLSLVFVEDRFFRILGGNAHRVVHLHELQLCQLSRKVCSDFARYFPKLTSIRRLSLKHVESSGDILRGLTRNSSVQHVTTFDGNSEHESDFDSKQLRLIQALCKRNKFLAAISNTEPTRRANQTRSRNCPSRDGGSSSSSKSNPMDAVDSMEKMELAICPSLLKVAQQTPGDCSAIVMRALLMLNQRVGDNKRGSIWCPS